MQNPVSWFEIATKDLARAKKFYAEVFGGDFQHIDMPDAQMEMFAGGPEGIGAVGALVQSGHQTPSPEGALLYFECADVAVEAAKVEAAGGKLLLDKTSVGPFGFIAQFMDTEGNRVGLHSHQ